MKLTAIILENDNKVDQLAAALGSEFKTLANGINA